MIEVLYVDDKKAHREAFKKSIEECWNGGVSTIWRDKLVIDTQPDLYDDQKSSGLLFGKLSRFDAVLLDLVWERRGKETLHGVELARRIRQLYPEMPILMLTQKPDSGAYGELVKIGIDGFLLKEYETATLCIQLWESIVDARRDQRGHALYKLIRRSVEDGAWGSDSVANAASVAWLGERPLDRWNSFWTAMEQPLAKHGLSAVFDEMSNVFANADLLLLGSAPNMRGHLEHVLSVYFSGYVISHQVPGFKEIAVSRGRLLATSFFSESFSDDEIWECFQLAWLAAATLHDTAYSIELLGDIQQRCSDISRAFSGVVTVDPAIETRWAVDKFQPQATSMMNDIVNVLNKIYSNNQFTIEFLEKNGVYNKKGNYRVNHGLASGLLFISNAEKVWTTKGKTPLLRPFMIWAGAAMALHSMKIPGKNEGCCIAMEMDPLSYLLMICDEIQVWDRERPDASVFRSPFRESHLSRFELSTVGAKTCVDCLIECVPYRDVHLDDPRYATARKTMQKGFEDDSNLLSKYVSSKSLEIRLHRVVRGLDEFKFVDVEF